MIELWAALDHTGLLADTAPFDLDPHLGITSCRDSLNDVELSHIDYEVAQVLLQALETTRLLKLGLGGQADETLDRCALELLLSVELVAMDLHLNLELAIEHALQANTSRNSDISRTQALVEQPNLEELFCQLRLCASVDNSFADFLPVGQLRIFERYRLRVIRDHIRRRHAELQLGVDRGAFNLIITILEIGCPPVDELDHIVPDFLEDKFEVKAHLQLFEIAITLNLVVDVDLLVDGARG